MLEGRRQDGVINIKINILFSLISASKAPLFKATAWLGYGSKEATATQRLG